MSANNFISGAGLTHAADADDYLIYNTTDGSLYFDADGSGTGGTAQLITTLGNLALLTNFDFTII